MRVLRIAGLLATIGLLLAVVCISASANDYYRQTVKNPTGDSVNDARVTFDGTPVGCKLKTKDDPPKRATGVPKAGQSNVIIFGPGSGWELDDAGKLYIDWENPAKGGVLKMVSVMWTYDGEDQGKGEIGARSQITEDQYNGKQKVAVFENPYDYPVTYKNIVMTTNNNASNYTIDDYLTVTGTLVAGVPTSITLNAHESRSIPFGHCNNLNYVLATADMAAVSTPDDTYSIGMAAIVPEPCGLSCLFAGLAVVGTALRRRRS